MNDLHEDEQVIRQFMKDQLNVRKENKQENDNSFIFLEKGTLNNLMNHLLTNAEQKASGDSQVQIIGILDQIIADNQKDFEEIITFLKDRP